MHGSFPRLARSLQLLSLALVTTSVAVAQSKPIKLPRLSPTTPQGMEGGFWKVENNFDPILRLKNVLLNQPLVVTPTLYFADGTPYQLPEMELEPAGTRQVNLRIALQSVPASLRSHVSAYGMAGIAYHWSWQAVIATIKNTDEITSLTVSNSLLADVRTVHATPESGSAQVTRGQWWLPTANADAYVVLENTSLSPKQVTVQFSGHAGNNLATQQVSLPSHATNVVRLSAALANVHTQEKAGGIEIRYTGPEHGLVAYTGIEDESVGFSASPRTYEDHLDPNRPVHQVNLTAPGLMLGKADPAMLFPTETYFKPYAYLHNVSSKPLQVNLSIASQGDDDVPHDHSLGQMVVQPGETSQFDFSSQFGSANPMPDGYGNLTASFQGRDGDLILSTGSVDQSQSYVFEVTPSQQIESASRTLCFWSLEGDNDSMISVWNYKSRAQDLVLTLRYSGGHYDIPIHLAARQSYNLDMMNLVRSRVPDPSGTLIPSNITTGSGTLAGAGGETDRIAVSVASSVFNVRNATCGENCTTCNGATEFQLDPGSYQMALNATMPAYGKATWNTGSSYMNPSGTTWTTANSSIATVNAAGVLTGASPGHTGVTALVSNYPVYTQNCSGDMQGGCPDGDFEDGGEATVVQVSQTPSTIGMSSGDTSDALNVTVSPASADTQSGSSISYGIIANPYSSSAASITFNEPSLYTGSDSWGISVSGGTSASGIFQAQAVAQGTTSGNSTIITIPPQTLIQMMYAEANGTGNQTAMLSLGLTIWNRFTSPYFDGTYTTWQNSLVPGQVALDTSITTGITPELTAALGAFNNQIGNWCGALSWWSPTPAQWKIVQSAITSGTTTFPTGTGAPTYSSFNTSIEQIVYVSSVGSASGGQPNFLYLIPRTSNSPAAVSSTCF